MPDPWPHAPSHRFTERGLYIITAGTLNKEPHFDTAPKRDLVLGILFEQANLATIGLQAWAVLHNHYHLVVSFEHTAPSLTLSAWMTQLHAAIGRGMNKLDSTPGRRVMHQYWDTALTFEKSWLARLHYVHHNPVHHQLVALASDYPWCSASWFETNARPSFVQTVYGFKLDRVNMRDDF